MTRDMSRDIVSVATDTGRWFIAPYVRELLLENLYRSTQTVLLDERHCPVTGRFSAFFLSLAQLVVITAQKSCGDAGDHYFPVQAMP